MRLSGRGFKGDCFLLIILAVVLFSGCYLVENYSIYSELKNAFREDRISASMLDNGTVGKLIKRLGLVESIRNDGKRFPALSYEETQDGDRLSDEINFRKKRKPGYLLYRVRKNRSESVSDSFDPKKVIQKGDWPILDIRIPDRSLYDPKIGIVNHREKYGKDWERPCVVTFYDKGDILFQSGAGLRIQGGRRRTTKDYWNYKLHFREEYGKRKIPAGLILKNTGYIKKLVINLCDWPSGQPMNNPLAYDIARQVGSLTPETRLFEVYVNGKSRGMGFVVQYYGKAQFDQYMENEEYLIHKYKDGISGSKKVLFSQYIRIPVEQNEPLSQVGEKIDLEGFLRHVFALIFSGDEDYCQGVALLDYLTPGAKMQWIQWDMDHCFHDFYKERDGLLRENWQQTGVRLFYRKNHFCDRTWLFSNLINNYPGFKEMMLRVFSEILNHRLIPEFLTSRVSYYDRMISEFGDYSSYIKMLNEFMEKRPGFIRDDIAKTFGLEKPVDVTVHVPEEALVKIDGFEYAEDYQGHYFKGQQLRLEAMPGTMGKYAWQINGRTVNETALDLAVNTALDIRLVDK